MRLKLRMEAHQANASKMQPSLNKRMCDYNLMDWQMPGPTASTGGKGGIVEFENC